VLLQAGGGADGAPLAACVHILAPCILPSIHGSCGPRVFASGYCFLDVGAHRRKRRLPKIRLICASLTAFTIPASLSRHRGLLLTALAFAHIASVHRYLATSNKPKDKHPDCGYL